MKIDSVLAKWPTPDGNEYMIGIPIYKNESDERLIERAWNLVKARLPPEQFPANKSDIKIHRRKKKK